jgi:hypothetical protein
MKRSAIFLALAVLAAPVLVQSQAEPDIVGKIVDEGKNRNQVMNHLRHLTKNIGPRLTGSPQLQRACEWTAQKFREYGLQNVKLEQWGEVPVGFERGKRQVGRMVAPYAYDFEFTSPAWSPGTKGLVRGDAVIEPATMAEYEKVKSQLRGAWVIRRAAAGFGGGRGGGRPGGAPGGAASGAATGSEQQTEAQKVAELVSKAGIAGTVSSSRNDLVITSGRFTGLDWNNLPKDVRITIRKRDADTVIYNLEQGKKVTLEFDLQQRFIKGPVPIYNVIADIPGTEKPDEIVIVSGHLDSWDGPGAEGCCDNGTGTMVALETARILMKVGARPKRTIRFIMWTGEEQGLHGSRRYVEMHKDELSKISCVFVDDGGTNYQGGLSCTKDMEPLLREALAPAMKAFPELPMEIRVVERIPRGGGSDHAPFNAAGVPGFFWFETGRSDYNYVHHTQHDKLEMAIPEYLVQSATNSAAASYIMACAPTLLPREAAPTPPPTGGSGGGGGK